MITSSARDGLLSETGVPRIRLSSLDPNDVSTEMIDLLASNKIFCNHLHICIQAFSDSTLKRMNRRYRMSHVLQLLDYISKKWQDRSSSLGEKLIADRTTNAGITNISVANTQCAVGTDLIVGFPGESRQDVEQGIELFLALPLTYLHVFPYSERQNTPATRLGGVVDVAERRRVAARWRALSENRRRQYYRSLVGCNLEMLVETAQIIEGPATEELATGGVVGEQIVLSGTSREFATVKTILPRTALGGDLQNALGKTLLVKADVVDEQEGEILCSLLNQKKSKRELLPVLNDALFPNQQL